MPRTTGVRGMLEPLNHSLKLNGGIMDIENLKEKGNYCDVCQASNKDIVEEDDDTIYLTCFNCGASDEIYKTSKEEFIERLEMDYEWADVCEYADEYFQNLLSMEENIDEFKRWYEMKFEGWDVM